MRIARVVTICAALISTLIGAETERPRRRSQPKNHLSPPRIENISTTPITFTTLQPELRSFSSQIDASVHFPNRRPRIRTSRFATFRLRESNRPKNTRHRRQLHRRAKKSRLGRSFDISETKTIETVHGPPKISEEIHIEPIVRVTKNKSVLDSIIDMIRRLIGTEKTLGPLVGPFHFPGVGDKVYVRLLDPVLPDHLVIRFVSHSPVTKAESPIGKDISLPIQLAKHPEILPAIAHESFVSPNELVSFSKHPVVASIASDSFLSSSNKVQASKPLVSHKFLGSGWNVPKTYGVDVNIHSNLTNTYQPSPLSTNNAVDWNFQPNGKIKELSYQDSFNQVYQPGTEDPGLKYVQDFHDPFNASDFQAENPFVPVQDYNVHQFENKFTSESPPKYSLDFVSKKMRYLNLDGSVSDDKDGGFKPMEDPTSKGVRVIRKIQVRRKEIGTNEKDRKGAEKSRAEVNRKIDDITNVVRNETRLNEDDSKEYFPNFGQRFQNESSTEPGNVKPVLTKEQSNSTDSRTI
ncbi:uncharacterized protein LOC105663217 [Megachile rotundata]|uniref:uncharacterized protein LOC105663217 n=1 Tax=Megachile rotundata TaxID=143995 RepID=UPI003FD10CA0